MHVEIPSERNVTQNKQEKFITLVLPALCLQNVNIWSSAWLAALCKEYSNLLDCGCGRVVMGILEKVELTDG